MKVAIVGIGSVARHQINAINQLAGVIDLVGAYDSDASAAKGRAAPCHFHISLGDLIENSTADVIVVATPSGDHFATASKLLNSGRAVMVEKPVCESREDLHKLTRVAKAGNIFFHAAFHAAFGNDLIWWVKNRHALTDRYGRIERILMNFFDPYIGKNGLEKKSGIGLGGSWYDSGINALSVLAYIADPASISIVSAKMVSSMHCNQTSACTRLRCDVDGEVCTGEINTDWMLGLDSKTTLLSYERATVLLDHSNEQVVIRDGQTFPKTISLKNGLARLINHYVGVFRDLEGSFVRHRGNIGLSTRLHELLFDAMDENGRGQRGELLGEQSQVGPQTMN